MNFASHARAGMRGLIVEGGHPGLQDAEARQARRSNGSACAAREVACSIAASVAPLFRLRKATNDSRRAAFSEAKTGC